MAQSKSHGLQTPPGRPSLSCACGTATDTAGARPIPARAAVLRPRARARLLRIVCFDLCKHYVFSKGNHRNGRLSLWRAFMHGSQIARRSPSLPLSWFSLRKLNPSSGFSALAAPTTTEGNTWSGPSSPTSAASTASRKRSREFIRGPWDHSGAIHVPFDVGAVLPPPMPAAINVRGLEDGAAGVGARRPWAV